MRIKYPQVQQLKRKGGTVCSGSYVYGLSNIDVNSLRKAVNKCHSKRAVLIVGSDQYHAKRALKQIAKGTFDMRVSDGWGGSYLCPYRYVVKKMAQWSDSASLYSVKRARA